MYEIQCWLRVNLKAHHADGAREDWLHNHPSAPDALSFWLRIEVDLSATEPWWYDTLVAYARRCRQSDEEGGAATLPAVFVDWCVGVAAKDIFSPKQLGRPPNELRDRLICEAVEAYMGLARFGGPLPQLRACARVAEAVGLEENSVAKIWGRRRRGKQ